MAYMCIKYGSSECDGCGACDAAPASKIGKCAACGGDVYPYDERYEIEDELIHAECLTDWAKKYEVIK